MECKVCSAKIDTPPLKIKEMMFGTGKFYPYFKCPSCDCLQLELPENDRKDLYPTNYYSFNTYNTSGIVKKIKQTIIRYSVANALGYKSFLSSVFRKKNRDGGAHSLKNKISKEAAILDVGCGDGSLIDALHWLGYKNLTGIDPYLNNDVVKDNYQLLKKSIETMAGNETFDIIMLHHSFEHVENPMEVMGHIKRLLTEHGLCIIRIPVADSYAFDFYKENWVQLDAPRHFFLHTNRSMEIIAAKNDLNIEAIVNDSLEFQFIGSEQYQKGIALSSPQSYYVPFYKKFFFNKKHLFSNRDIKQFIKQAEELNKTGKGDQRIYYIRK